MAGTAAFRPARRARGEPLRPAGGGMWRPQPRSGGTDRRRRDGGSGKEAAGPGERGRGLRGDTAPGREPGGARERDGAVMGPGSSRSGSLRRRSCARTLRVGSEVWVGRAALGRSVRAGGAEELDTKTRCLLLSFKPALLS